ncbi:uncharacterized protein LOC122057194 [Macadamia integrifolia]|uniref:uncharacterized protein LOC122057194 n=1 Tax=Macadamia integrifolia TaxID=60698 RepID=UPI001C52E588|nr:uncharacterized protein LOC122057194 [Macadamia integrifolia]
MRKRNKKAGSSHEPKKSLSLTPQQQQSKCYEGEDLDSLLKSIGREIELERLSKGALPEKIWIKQQFSIGVNDITRVLERMMTSAQLGNSSQKPLVAGNYRKPSIQLQAVLLASDCNPRWLTKHLPSLASSREVPVIFVKDNKGGSLRLGELVKLKTAIAIGVKARGSGINKLIQGILHDDQIAGDNGVLEAC